MPDKLHNTHKTLAIIEEDSALAESDDNGLRVRRVHHRLQNVEVQHGELRKGARSLVHKH